ncbi:MAG: hypothetical protein Q7R95_11485 [bacterium]|nr:hypothetical protein [bacterium]
MKTVKLDNEQAAKAAQMIKDGNAQLASAKKQVDAGKATLATILKEERAIDLSTLAIGEMVNVDKVCLIEVGKQTRFDQATFQLEHPTVFAQYQKEFPTLKFKPLV